VEGKYIAYLKQYRVLHSMKRTTERGKAENIYKSYQKQEKPARSGTSKKIAGTMTMESSTSKSKAVPKKAKEDDDSGEDDGDEDPKEEGQGHEMTPVRKRMDVQVVKSSYGPIQEMPTVQERQLELSIDDAIGTLRTVLHVITEERYRSVCV
jgi:hypothetical protein